VSWFLTMPKAMPSLMLSCMVAGPQPCTPLKPSTFPSEQKPSGRSSAPPWYRSYLSYHLFHVHNTTGLASRPHHCSPITRPTLVLHPSWLAGWLAGCPSQLVVSRPLEGTLPVSELLERAHQVRSELAFRFSKSYIDTLLMNTPRRCDTLLDEEATVVQTRSGYQHSEMGQ
jgi:hypothetical protein